MLNKTIIIFVTFTFISHSKLIFVLNKQLLQFQPTLSNMILGRSTISITALNRLVNFHGSIDLPYKGVRREESYCPSEQPEGQDH